MTSPTTARHATWQSTRCGHSSPVLSVQLRATENAHSQHPEAAPQASPILSTMSQVHTRVHTHGVSLTRDHMYIYMHTWAHTCMQDRVCAHKYTDHTHIHRSMCAHTQRSHAHRITCACRSYVYTRDHKCTQDYTHDHAHTGSHTGLQSTHMYTRSCVHRGHRSHTASHVCRHAHKVMHTPSREHVSTHTCTHTCTQAHACTQDHTCTHVPRVPGVPTRSHLPGSCEDPNGRCPGNVTRPGLAARAPHSSCCSLAGATAATTVATEPGNGD